MDRTGAYSPIDRRRYPLLFAFRNSAVLKSWLFLATRTRVPCQLHESCLHVFYRLDAAEAEMVHRIILKTAALSIGCWKRPDYFPATANFVEWSPGSRRDKATGMSHAGGNAVRQ
jgi:hypothetical protein